MTRLATRAALAAALVCFLLPIGSSAQQTPQTVDPTTSGIDDTIEAGEADAEEPRRRLVRWNEFEGPFFTFRMGAGLLYDVASYAQDDDSRQQLTLDAEGKLRDFRLLLKGRLKFKRAVTWSSGIMYDAANEQWLFRETGLMVEVPELSGHIFVGRTKEGFSLNKVMVGYAGWTMERSTISDATIPILADGVKWLGYAPAIGLVWTLGVYGDWLSEDQAFSSYDNQIAGRLARVTLRPNRTLLHVGLSARYGTPDDGMLRLRSRPEINPAPYFVDTSAFAADSTTMVAPEVYFRRGSLLLGSEYFFQNVDAAESGDPFFHGGDVVATWVATGETRTYNTRGGFFNQVSPARTVFEGGRGAWELVGRFSYVDLEDGTLSGGRFWRLTPMVNWYLSDHVRLEAAYGFGSLDRFALVGKTHFFQSRLQLQF